MNVYTAFCREANNTGTTWISSFEADTIEDAISIAEADCAEDWGCEPSEVKCIGLAFSDVDIAYWDDIE